MSSAEETNFYITKLSEGYMAKGSMHPNVSVFAETKEEALSKVCSAIDEFREIFPDKI